MNHTPIPVIMLITVLLIIGCSKKVSKVQPVPDQIIEKTAENANTGANSLSIDQESLESAIKEVFVPVYFDYDNAVIMNSEKVKLERIASFLQNNPSVHVLIEGHCDERGSSEYNMGLGESRARAVQQWLKGYGIAESRIDITSFGKERPALTGCVSDNCYAKNRRDEWRVIVK
ncbi:MAG: OmpA family protein [Fibrobacter sp.]|nr:OmpA family protein [Fibrobacter sp.]